MLTLEQAIELERWDAAALLIVKAMLDIIRRTPPDMFPQMLEALVGELLDEQEPKQ